MPTIASNLPLIIIGTGISGLALAQGLLKASMPFRVFERDTRLNLRTQGYRFRVQDPGVSAVKAILTPAHWARVKATSPELIAEGAGPLFNLEALTADPREGVPKGPGPNGPKPEGDPAQRFEGQRRFSKEFSSYEITSAGVTVRIRDGSEVEGSLLVGADGARSRVRKQFLPDHGLVDTEGRMIYGKTALSPELIKYFPSAALRGIWIVQDNTQTLPLTLLLEAIRFPKNNYTDELPSDYVYWVLMARKDRLEDDATNLSLDSAETAALAKQLTSRWHPSFHALFDLQNQGQTSLLSILSARPNLPVWPASNHVTLIGDAVHLMSPTSGSGATTALRDAATLVEVLRDGGVSAESVGRYEERMRVYAGEVLG